MRTFTLRRIGGMVAVAVAGMTAAGITVAGPASALGLTIGGPTLLHVEDCRSASLTRQLSYDLEFSSKTTGPVNVHTPGVVVDGSITMCWSADVWTASSVQVTTWTDATVDSVLAAILGESDPSKVCSAVRLQTAPGVRVVVSTTTHAHVSVDGAPPVNWNFSTAPDTKYQSNGEDVILKACADTSGQASAS